MNYAFARFFSKHFIYDCKVCSWRLSMQSNQLSYFARIFLIAPCFNMRQLDRQVISIRTWYSSSRTFRRSVIQYLGASSSKSWTRWAFINIVKLLLPDASVNVSSNWRLVKSLSLVARTKRSLTLISEGSLDLLCSRLDS